MYKLFKKLLFTVDPELAHELVKKTGLLFPKGLARAFLSVKNPLIGGRIGKTVLANPIGLAAGFDKNGEMVDWMAAIGFGFVEVGSVTAKPCEGQPKPRIFRLPKEESLQNRMGLPNEGAKAIAKRLTKIKSGIPVGINIAKTPKSSAGIGDWLETLQIFKDLGSYTVLNLSCPNTPDGKTFEEPAAFRELAKAVAATRADNVSSDKPFFMKVSPDLSLSTLRVLVTIALDAGFDGFVVTNSLAMGTRGGLTGRGLKEAADRQLKNVYDMVGRKKIIIGVGGIMDFRDLVEKLSLGASLFQIYTGLIYRGPFFVKHLNKQLVHLCQKMGVKNYAELSGSRECLKAL